MSRSVCGSRHAVDVADLPGEIEDDLAVAHEIVHRARLADVGDIDADTVFDARDVGEVAAVVGDERIDEQHVGAEIGEPAGEIAADEAEPARDHHAPAAIELRSIHEVDFSLGVQLNAAPTAHLLIERCSNAVSGFKSARPRDSTCRFIEGLFSLAAARGRA